MPGEIEEIVVRGDPRIPEIALFVAKPAVEDTYRYVGFTRRKSSIRRKDWWRSPLLDSVEPPVVGCTQGNRVTAYGRNRSARRVPFPVMVSPTSYSSQ